MAVILFVVILIVWCAIEEDSRKKKRLKEAYTAQPFSERLDVPGSAKFITDKKELKKAGLLGRRGIQTGQTIEGDQPIRFDQDCHTCVIAPSGAGKTTEFAITNVLSNDGFSLFVMDGKCEIAPVTIAHRAKLGPAYILNSHEMNMDYLRGYEMAQYNPMARLFDPKEPRLNIGPILEKISDGCVMAESVSDNESFWTGGGRGLLTGLMIGQAKYGKPDERNLPAVRRMLSGDVVAHCKRLLATNDPMVRDRLEMFTIGGRDTRSMDDIIRTANIQTRFLADEGVAHMLARSTFKFSQLKEQICTVYLCSNLDFLDVNQRTARLAVTCAISELQRPDIRKKVPVWMLCDEAYHYGYMASIEAAYGAVRGAGVRLCTIWTDLAQMEKRYGGMSRTILGNSGATVMMATGDDRTAEHISKLCGLSSVVTSTPNVSLRDGWPQVSWGKHISQQPLLPAHSAMLIPANRTLVFIRGLGPVMAKKVPYFKTALRSIAGRNPYQPDGSFLKRVFGR